MCTDELQKSQNVIDALFYDDKVLTQSQHALLEGVISIAQAKIKKPDVIGRKNLIIDFLIYLNNKGLINNFSFDYEKEVKKYLQKINRNL
jgi:hypothetical protein